MKMTLAKLTSVLVCLILITSCNLLFPSDDVGKDVGLEGFLFQFTQTTRFESGSETTTSYPEISVEDGITTTVNRYFYFLDGNAWLFRVKTISDSSTTVTTATKEGGFYEYYDGNLSLPVNFYCSVAISGNTLTLTENSTGAYESLTMVHVSNPTFNHLLSLASDPSEGAGDGSLTMLGSTGNLDSLEVTSDGIGDGGYINTLKFYLSSSYSNYVYLYMFFPTTAVTSGTYSFSDTEMSTVNTFTDYSSIYLEGDEYPLTGGTITIAVEGSTYTITGTVTTDGGSNASFSYIGPMFWSAD